MKQRDQQDQECTMHVQEAEQQARAARAIVGYVNSNSFVLVLATQATP
jgi:hypothetical protein